MAYSVQADLEFAAGGLVRLTQLTDWNNTTALDVGIMNQAIAAADAEINAYAKKFYDVPITPVPVELAQCSARIAVYKMAAGRGMVTDEAIKAHELDIAWLKGISDGEIALGVSVTPAKSSMRIDRPSDRPTSKEVSRAKLNGFR